MLDNPEISELFSALPSICANCGIDYSKSSSETTSLMSPVRSFRTGFGKVSQLLAKEMFTQLPEDLRKTVIFSDSRQDAADLALDIESSHFSELFRDLFVKHIRNSTNSSYTF